MPTAILIGFEYCFNSLPGTIIDIYHAYKWCKSFGCTIHVLTDIEFIKYPDNLQDAVNRKIAQSDLLTFYTDIFAKDRIGTVITNEHNLIMNIIRILTLGVSDNKLVIYYSGHGVKDSMVMPSKTLLSFVDFKENILNSLNPYVEIFWILDCCNPNGLHLPYKLDGNAFALSPSKIECVLQPILLITSAEATEKSIATKLGSVFSRHLFRLLSLMNNDSPPPVIKRKSVTIPTYKSRNIRRLIGNLASSIRKMHTGYAQTVSAYSSYITDPILWLWIGTEKPYDIVTDITLSVLMIRPRQMQSQTQSPIQITFAQESSNINMSSNPYDILYPE